MKDKDVEAALRELNVEFPAAIAKVKERKQYAWWPGASYGYTLYEDVINALPVMVLTVSIVAMTWAYAHCRPEERVYKRAEFCAVPPLTEETVSAPGLKWRYLLREGSPAVPRYVWEVAEVDQNGKIKKYEPLTFRKLPFDAKACDPK